MSGTSFRDLLHYTTATAPKPPILANGHYIGTIRGHEFGKSRNKGTPQVQILLTAEEECEDVEKGANDGVNIGDADLRRTFYITPKAVRRIGTMLDAVLGPDERYFDERLPETRGARVMFSVSQRENEDGTDTYMDVGTIVRA